MSDKITMPISGFFGKTIGYTTDFQRTYLFKVLLPNYDDVTYFVSSTATPVETSGVINVHWMNTDLKIGGRTTFGEWTVTVRDKIDSGIYKYFESWRTFVFDKTQGTSLIPGAYKDWAILQLLDNQGHAQQEFELRGAFPTSVGSATYDYSNEGIVTFAVTFAYDDFVTMTGGSSMGQTIS